MCNFCERIVTRHHRPGAALGRCFRRPSANHPTRARAGSVIML
ncbi:hypothetical protein AB395_00003515 [Sinorhizobium fredii CCBAU 45436]|nr:hypothetical protein SF83666_c33470 [Sinorhizobium fredii CCBAU 83666]AWI59150.1 hypothetical protein AB395_00003515 [Sinorhizobium fredii CCBAU 45436]